MNEEWKTIKWAKNYAVSSMGRVKRITEGRRTHPGRILKPTAMQCGYMVVHPVVDGKNKQEYIHRIVADHFVSGDGDVTNHIDGDKHNNRADNLEKVTHAANMSHAARTGLMRKGETHPGAKLSNEDVRQMRIRHKAGEGTCALAQAFGVAASTTSQIVNMQRRVS